MKLAQFYYAPLLCYSAGNNERWNYIAIVAVWLITVRLTELRFNTDLTV